MKISAVVAQEIVFELKSIISQEINFMNQEGFIIASTDKKRIYNFHEGAHQVLLNDQTLMITTDDEYRGSKKGINMPICFENQTIGVVGITGEPAKVEHNGLIIKKMTEILIRDTFLKDVMIKENERSRYIINQILNYNLYQSSEIPTNVFSYDYFSPHFCIVGSYDDKEISDFAYDEISRLINKYRSNYDIISGLINDKLYLFVEATYIEEVKKWLEYLCQEITQYTKNTFYFGLGPISDSLEMANQSFQYALESLNWNIKETKSPYLSFDEMDLGLLLSSVEQDRVEFFQYNLLNKIPSTEFEELKELLLCYGEMNKSVNQTADKLFIHKNTVQYRLDKIYKYTGYNPRILNDYVRLYLAFLLSS